MPHRKTACLQSVLLREALQTIIKHNITGIKAAFTGAAVARFPILSESLILPGKMYPSKKRNN
jgi:hypothetical protein